jgi:hypothetical protein
MIGQQPPKPPAPPGSIEFEVTDFDSARQALDELPPGVEEVKHLLAGSFDHQRRKPTASDRALTGPAMDWVIGLPPALRPHATCEQFPRVINAIAAAWDDSARSVQVIDHMINDYRGGRRGFPEVVQRELSALHAYRRARSGG